MRIFIPFYVSFFLALDPLFGQANLITEDFNVCSLPANWEVHLTGNQNPVWYVGDAVQNNDNFGQSMNGSCFLFIDDDATGDQTPSFVMDIVSPVFDASQYPTIELSVDVHYRDWNEADESFDVILSDGTAETLIRRYDQYRSTGTNVYDYETLVFDLALLTKSPTARIIFRYNDAGGFNWWAGIDNFSVIGKGQGTNVIAESFNGCEKPAGWATEVLTGNDDWKFGLITEGAALGGSNSMDGSCFVFFDDDFLGASAPYSVARLISPWFDGSQFSTFTVDFDVILRYYSEKIAVIVQQEDGQEFVVRESQGNVGGPYFHQYVHTQLDLSPYRSKQMRVIFEYDDGQDFGWWAGLDNIKITGNGTSSDVCLNARTLLTGQNCLEENNLNALLDGPASGCAARSTGGLWYTWTADFTGTAQFVSNARFNDVIDIFTGDCSSLQPLFCNNRDEHGFTGESTYFQVTSGNVYLIRVSGTEGMFGKPRGMMCVQVNQVGQMPQPPANDDCLQAQAIIPGNPCDATSNFFAETSPTLPSHNQLARHDLWYRFIAPVLLPEEYLEFQTKANFSDIITLYTGGCDQLSEVATNHKGQNLICNNLVPGQSYWIQVSGTFATVEGSICPSLLQKTQSTPPNGHCQEALALTIGGDCTSGSNIGAGFSGVRPPCVPYLAHDVWYSFTAPASGSIRINSGADFPHVLAVWKGLCNNLTNIRCEINPLRCDGFITLGALSAGDTYYIQIGSLVSTAGTQAGTFCVQLTDGSQNVSFEPMDLQVTEKCISTNVTKLKVDISGGIGPYQIIGNQNGDILASGESYLVVVVDQMGCIRSYEGLTEDCEAQDCAITGTLTGVPPSCYNGNNGTLSAMVTGGTAPYSYLWSNGSTAADVNNLTPGTYSATVTDAVDCELVLTSTITNPLVITAVPTSIEQPHPGMSDGAIYVDVAGGTGIYQYTWLKNNVTVATSEDLTGAAAGDYTLIITDNNGCTSSYDFTLTETVSNKEVTESFFTEVFPNPTHEKAWLAVSFPKPQTLHLSLWDASGKVIHTWTVRNATEQNIPLDLKNLPAGNYQLRIQTAQGLAVETIVKR